MCEARTPSAYQIVRTTDDQRWHYDLPVPSQRQTPTGSESLDLEKTSSPRLGYLLKHAQLLFREMTTAAFAPLGIRPTEWAALNCLDEQHGLSQKEIAELLGVDRTTMVAIVDELQGKGLVARQPHAVDRRKNTVTLTSKGRTTMHRGALLVDGCERQFLAAVDQPDVDQLKRTLQTVIISHREH